MTASPDVLDLVRRWAAAERDNDAGALDGILDADFAGVGPVARRTDIRALHRRPPRMTADRRFLP